MDERISSFYLFPHSVIPELPARFMALAFPHLALFRGIREPLRPEWLDKRVVEWSPPDKEAIMDHVEAFVRGCREMASIHGPEGLRMALGYQAAQESREEYRTHIQSYLKGGVGEDVSARQWLLAESIAFMELARDFDERELELSESVSRVDGLESQLIRSIAGEDEEDAEFIRAIETENPPLTPDWGFLSFMLRRRIGAWLRLLAASLPSGPVILVAVDREVPEEVEDPFQTEWERKGRVWDPLNFDVLRLPRVDLMDGESYASYLRSVEESETWRPWVEALDAFSIDPSDERGRNRLKGTAESFQEVLWEKWRETVTQPPPSETVGWKLTYPTEINLGSVWRRFDREGYAELSTSCLDSKPVVLFHVDFEVR